MFELHGFSSLELLKKADKVALYRGIRQSDQLPVLVKKILTEPPNLEDLKRLQEEYLLLTKLPQRDVPKPLEFIDNGKQAAFALQDDGELILSEYLKEHIFSIKQFLELAISLTDVISDLHARGIVHKDIKPANILINVKTNTVKIINFDTVIAFPWRVYGPEALRETLAYISPEQTGRMNRTIDYRTDFYSLGITFYEMLTKQIPYHSEDAIGMVHAHIAKIAQAPDTLNAAIPKSISNIIMKLIAKVPEQRYQSTYGLRLDLEKCLHDLNKTGEVKTFELAKHDVSKHFIVSSKLYGREKELGLLHKMFASTKVGKANFLLVTGYAGIGKSSLVNEIHKEIAALRGYYCAAKFDQFQGDTPYSALISILKALIKQILTETETSINAWKLKILDQIGATIGFITHIVPELELIVGTQESYLPEDSANAEALFYRAIKDFIQLFATEEHPTVLFFDDMQWSNFSSLKFLEYLMTSDTHYLFVIGAYRANEVSKEHRLAIMIDAIHKSQIPLREIELSPLTLKQVNHLVADTLFRNPIEISDLAELCFEKTRGNPFFINQLLNLMYNEGLINFNTKDGQWTWDINKIKKLAVTDNVIDLMISKLEKFPEQTKQILKLAACIGNTFSLDLLKKITDTKRTKTEEALLPALQEGYILPYEVELRTADDTLPTFVFKFLHDKVQLAAYQLIDENEKKLIHKKIGEILLRDVENKNLRKNIFNIVNHLNIAKDLIADPKEKIQLAELNLMAAEVAKNSVAFHQAYSNVKLGLHLLDANTWQDHYALTLSLHKLAALLAYLTNNHKNMEKICKEVFKHVTDPVDRAPFYEIKIDTYTKQDKCQKAIKTLCKSLEELGVVLPRRFLKLHILKKLIQLKLISLFKSPESIINHENKTDQKSMMIAQLFFKTMPAAQSKSMELFAVITLTSALLSIKHGNTSNTSVAYIFCALIFFRIGDIKSSRKFFQVALKLGDKLHNKREKGITLFSAAAFIEPWTGPLRSALNNLLESYKIAFDLGEASFLGYSGFFYCAYELWAGVELPKLITDSHYFLKGIKPYKGDIVITSLYQLLQLADNLISDKTDPVVLTGQYLQEKKWLARYQKTKNKVEISAFMLLKMYLNYLFGRYDEACHYADQIIADDLSASYGYAVTLFYDSLSRLAIYQSVAPQKQYEIMKKVRKNQRGLKKLCRFAPTNFFHKYYLVEAEHARVLDKNNTAVQYYDKAISLANEGRFLQEEALSNELAGKFYLVYNTKIAPCYLRDAYYLYKKWGATAKIKDLEKNYQGLLTDISEEAQLTQNDLPKTLDLSTILKASHVISSEMGFAKLLKKILRILAENIGANRCLFLLVKNQELYIEGEYTHSGKFLHILHSIPYMQSDIVPTHIIDYVRRTTEIIKIDDLANDKTFTNDLYFENHRPKSILCSPLLKHGELQGIFYFENNLAANAFTNDRLQVLNSLSSQIAISVENSRLYEAFKRFVPQEFLNLLQKQNVVDVQLGDYMQKAISVLFMDIAGFTSLSEKLTPKEVFQFINTYLSYMEPVISQHHGFIDKYIGDGIMALFPENPDDAVHAAIALQQSITAYNNASKVNLNVAKISARIGINTGSTILGTIGSKHRIDGSVIGDAVNTAARISDLNHLYGANILISASTRLGLKNPDDYCMRMIDKVIVKGKTEIVAIWQILTDLPREKEQIILQTFSQAWLAYSSGKLSEAKSLFNACLADYPNDKVAQYFVQRCDELLETGLPKDWNGVTILSSRLHF